MKKQVYDVVIVNMADSRVVSIIGRRLFEDAAEKRIETGVSRTNLDAYFVKSIKAGTKNVGDKV